MIFELLSLLLNTPTDALYWTILTGIDYEEKIKTYILLNQHEVEIQTKNCHNFDVKMKHENVKNFLKVRKKDFFTYDITTYHRVQSNNLTTVYSSWVLWFRVKLWSTDKYIFKDWDLLKISKSGSEAALREVASLHLKPILSKSHCTRATKNIINEIVFE